MNKPKDSEGHRQSGAPKKCYYLEKGTRQKHSYNGKTVQCVLSSSVITSHLK